MTTYKISLTSVRQTFSCRTVQLATVKNVTKWHTYCDISFFSDWPGNSPDLYLTEKLWAILKQKLQKVYN